MSRPRYAFRIHETGAVVLRCADIARFFVSDRTVYDDFEDPEDAAHQLRFGLTGVDVLGELPPGVDMAVDVLDAAGAVMGSYEIWDLRLEHAPGNGAAEATCWIISLPHAAAAGVWEWWRARRPDLPGRWAALPPGEREGWLEVAELCSPWSATIQPDRVHTVDAVLDGRDVVDLASFFCALGEAVEGPGGWVGSAFISVATILELRAEQTSAPLRVRWTNAEVARRNLTRTVQYGEDGRRFGYLDLAIRMLRGAGVELTLVDGPG
ncbi:hypothetical protein GCM10009827_057740 [Dactylosporangium maewongense]|uniref:Barstar (Barnase inhibitor) n=1 Tax=Dactylosporangium maewongense TaxID=634393 RepID=A0ABN2B484_9ACTN